MENKQKTNEKYLVVPRYSSDRKAYICHEKNTDALYFSNIEIPSYFTEKHLKYIAYRLYNQENKPIDYPVMNIINMKRHDTIEREINQLKRVIKLNEINEKYSMIDDYVKKNEDRINLYYLKQRIENVTEKKLPKKDYSKIELLDYIKKFQKEYEEFSDDNGNYIGDDTVFDEITSILDNLQSIKDDKLQILREKEREKEQKLEKKRERLMKEGKLKVKFLHNCWKRSHGTFEFDGYETIEGFLVKKSDRCITVNINGQNKQFRQFENVEYEYLK
ncbi:MAG TPA: hypothetical protein PK784_05500 [Tenuifilaceae bacterium]|nr:hypothetical protein [Tenuifilaceae bacterium]HPN21583.1 hypothetical protein [Tenuifilaceae bacterium]